MSVNETKKKSFNLIQFSEIGMMLASVISVQLSRFNDSSPVQLVHNDMMLSS